MKKALIFSIIILFLSVSAVSASENITDDGLICADNNFENDYPLENVSSEEYVPSDDFNVGNNISDNDNESNSTVSQEILIKSKNLVAYYKYKPVYKVQIVDTKGHPVFNKKVKFKFKGKTYNKFTNKKGFASLKIHSKPGNYKIKVICDDSSTKRTIKLFKSRTSSKNIKTVYGKRVNYKLRVVDNYGKAMKRTLVKFRVDKKAFRRYTNNKGIATLKLNHNSGKHVIRYHVKGIHGKNFYIVKNIISLKILKWGITGNHIKIPLIRKNMPNSYWVKKAVAATKHGLPLLVFKGGKGKSVFITAGVHGNEIPPQVAVMKLIKYLSVKPIKGTVYVIPFVNIKAAYHQLRLTEFDFNRVADVGGTVSNRIVNLIVKLKCDYYGDFHSTESPGDPGLNIVLGFDHTKKCEKLTNYLAKSCGVHKRFHYPGGIHLWTLVDWANYRGVPSVLCEVISNVNTVSHENAALSYKMMYQFLRYSSII